MDKKVQEIKMDKKSILYIVIIIVVITVVAFIIPSFTGNYLTNPKKSCTDSDMTLGFPDGKNYKEFGIVTNHYGKNFMDYCETRTNLQEYYCSGNIVRSRQYNCATKCFEGKCVD